MSTPLRICCLVLIAVAAPSCTRAWSQDEATVDGESPRVRVAEVREESFAESRTLLGEIRARPGALVEVSAPFDCQIDAISVLAEDSTHVGDALVEITATPDATGAVSDARAEVEAARDRLAAVQRRFDQRLATVDEVADAEADVSVARTHLESIRRSGVSSVTSIASPADGVVVERLALPGSWLSAGDPILRIRPNDAIEAVVGIQTADLDEVSIGHVVTVRSPDGAFAPFDGPIARLGLQLDPETRAVPAYIAVPPGVRVFEGQPIGGVVQRDAHTRLVIPHASLIPRDDGFVVFAVRDGAAVEVAVEIRAEDHGNAAVDAPDLRAGDEVVIEGGYPLEDGAEVEVLR